MEPKPSHYNTKQFEFRYLEETDYNKGMFQVLSQLTKAPKPSINEFKEFWQTVSNASNKHINIVGVEIQSGRIIAFGSIIITPTVLHGRVGKIQNIVTSKAVRGKGLGKIIILALKEEGWKQQCNKITLFCEDKNVKFYEKLGFKTEGTIFASYKI